MVTRTELMRRGIAQREVRRVVERARTPTPTPSPTAPTPMEMQEYQDKLKEYKQAVAKYTSSKKIADAVRETIRKFGVGITSGSVMMRYNMSPSEIKEYSRIIRKQGKVWEKPTKLPYRIAKEELEKYIKETKLNIPQAEAYMRGLEERYGKLPPEIKISDIAEKPIEPEKKELRIQELLTATKEMGKDIYKTADFSSVLGGVKQMGKDIFITPYRDIKTAITGTPTMPTEFYSGTKEIISPFYTPEFIGGAKEVIRDPTTKLVYGDIREGLTEAGKEFKKVVDYSSVSSGLGVMGRDIKTLAYDDLKEGVKDIQKDYSNILDVPSVFGGVKEMGRDIHKALEEIPSFSKVYDPVKRTITKPLRLRAEEKEREVLGKRWLDFERKFRNAQTYEEEQKLIREFKQKWRPRGFKILFSDGAYNFGYPNWFLNLRKGFEQKEVGEPLVPFLVRKGKIATKEAYTDIGEYALYKDTQLFAQARDPKYLYQPSSVWIGKGVSTSMQVGAYVTPYVAPVMFLGGTAEILATKPKQIFKYAKEEPFEVGLALGYGAIKGYKAVKLLRKPIIETKAILVKGRKPVIIISKPITREKIKDVFGRQIIRERRLIKGTEITAREGRKTIITTFTKQKLGLKPIYEGYPYKNQKAYQKALKKLMKYGYTETKARTILRYKKPVVALTPYSAEAQVIYVGDKKPIVETLGVKIKQPLGIKTPELKIYKKQGEVEFIKSFGKEVGEKKGVNVFISDIDVERALLKGKGAYTPLSWAGKTTTKYQQLTGVQPVSFRELPVEHSFFGKGIREYKGLTLAKQIIPLKRKSTASYIGRVFVGEGKPTFTITKEPLIKVIKTPIKKKPLEIAFTKERAKSFVGTLKKVYGKPTTKQIEEARQILVSSAILPVKKEAVKKLVYAKTIIEPPKVSALAPVTVVKGLVEKPKPTEEISIKQEEHLLGENIFWRVGEVKGKIGATPTGKIEGLGELGQIRELGVLQSRFKEGLLSGVGLSPKELAKQISQQKGRLKLTQREKELMRSTSKTRSGQTARQKTIQAYRTAQKLLQIQIRRYAQITAQITKQISSTIQKPPSLPFGLPLVWPKGKHLLKGVAKKPIKKGIGYAVWVKRRGEWYKITKKFSLGFEEAKAYGFLWAKKTLGATFTLRPSKEPLKKIRLVPSRSLEEQFRTYRIRKGKRAEELPLTWIQKKYKVRGVGSRLGTKEELKEIMIAKFQKPPLKNKNKIDWLS